MAVGVLGAIGYFVIFGHQSTASAPLLRTPAAANNATTHNGQPAVAPTTPPTTAVDQEAAVVTAWRSAITAWVANALDPGGASAQLIDASFADPELSVIRNQLAAEKRDGLYSRGGIDEVAGSFHVILTSMTGATVTACETNHLQLLLPSGQPFPGAPGNPTPTADVAHATLVLTPDGWKVSSIETVNGPCVG